MCYGSSHGWGHLIMGHSLWGVKDGATHVTMGAPILSRLAKVQNSFSLEVSVALRGGSKLEDADTLCHRHRALQVALSRPLWSC